MGRRYVNVAQGSDNECGAAVLASISRHFGKPASVAAVRERSGTDRNGASLWGLKAAAEAMGFAARGCRAAWADLPRLPLPAVAHVRGPEGRGHFVVVYKVKRGKVLVADPAGDLRYWDRAAFERAWSGVLLVLEPSDRFGEGGERPLGLRDFLKLSFRHRRVLAEALAAAFLSTTLGMGMAFFVQLLVDQALSHHDVRLLHVMGLGMAAVILFQGLFQLLRGYLLQHLGQKLDAVLQGQYHRHVVGLPLGFFEARQTGEVAARTADVAAVSRMLSGTVLGVVLDASLAVLTFAVMACYSLPLALVSLGFLPFLALTTVVAYPALRRLQRRLSEIGAQCQARFMGILYGIASVKAFGGELPASLRMEGHLADLLRARFRLGLLSQGLGEINAFWTAAAALAVLWAGGAFVAEGRLTVGQLLSFHVLLGHFLGPVRGLAGAGVSIQEAAVAAGRVGEILSLPAEVDRERGKADPASVRGHIRIEKVSFAYGTGPDVLREVTFDIPAGSTVALVGESGSGKTTLCKLLVKFYGVERGRILVDGEDLGQIRADAWRRFVGWVDQECALFEGTVRENIALGDPGASFEQVVLAARQAGAHGFISRMPEGYQTRIGERGLTLSGGQRQRLAIARALVRQPRLLILDEATSHLDSLTEAAVQEALDLRERGRTTVVVAHRLSTVCRADRIAVFHEGAVVEEGTHEELLQRRGVYATHWNRQTGRAVDDRYS